jgi:hypothetical protein
VSPSPFSLCQWVACVENNDCIVWRIRGCVGQLLRVRVLQVQYCRHRVFSNIHVQQTIVASSWCAPPTRHFHHVIVLSAVIICKWTNGPPSSTTIHADEAAPPQTKWSGKGTTPAWVCCHGSRSDVNARSDPIPPRRKIEHSKQFLEPQTAR